MLKTVSSNMALLYPFTAVFPTCFNTMGHVFILYQLVAIYHMGGGPETKVSLYTSHKDDRMNTFCQLTQTTTINIIRAQNHISQQKTPTSITGTIDTITYAGTKALPWTSGYSLTRSGLLKEQATRNSGNR